MPQFRYEVKDKAGKPLRGVMDAPTEAEVRQRLVARGYSIGVIVPVGGPVSQPQAQGTPRIVVPRAVSGQTHGTCPPAKEMSVFFRGLASYLQSGQPIFQALHQIGTQSPNQKLRFVCETMAAKVQAGEQVSVAMAEFPKAFPQHVVGVVMAGELGGFLPVVVGDIALDYELAQRASVRYWRIVVWFLWINALSMLPLAVVPSQVFSTGPGGVDLEHTDLVSLLRVAMHGMGYGMKVIGIPVILLVAAYFIAAAILRQPSNRQTAHQWLLKVPWAGRASRERSMASFTRILWRLQSAGIQPIQSWDAASRAAENIIISQRLYSQLGAIKSGHKFSDSLMATGLFSSQDQRLLALGESSGQVPDILQRLAAFYEDAARSSANSAKWLGLRIAIIANMISLGIIVIGGAMGYPAMMNWVDKTFGA